MCVSLLMRQIHLNIVTIKSKWVPSECGELKRDENFNPSNVKLNFFLSLLLFNALLHLSVLVESKSYRILTFLLILLVDTTA